jgi:hypothetical protein
MAILRRSLVRSDGIALTMSLCSASGTFATCWDRTKDIYNHARTHLSLNKDAPVSRAVQAVGRVVPNPHLERFAPSAFGFDFREPPMKRMAATASVRCTSAPIRGNLAGTLRDVADELDHGGRSQRLVLMTPDWMAVIRFPVRLLFSG